MLETYLRNASVIEQAFETMKGGTGIHIDEIVTTFIKAEEQNYGLVGYSNQLVQECDILDDANAKLDR